MAMKLFMNKNNENKDNFEFAISDYHQDLSHSLEMKLLRNGLFFGKEISDEELESVKDSKRIEFLKQQNLLDHTLESLVELFDIIKKQIH